MKTEIAALEHEVQDVCVTMEQLRHVAECAKNLVAGARDLDMRHASVSESSLVLLETALAAAGYDADEEELKDGLRRG